ncbi:polysaccharide pyruvyl transferase family protein [Oceanobacillus neutriphilus]|uniref:Polysaccharide pyruvyl transferase CsaB n=1 Tax=Oceanobacillus neutriphilus TaxID=531815 RepID=A0ABQ2NS17_9BACI|nr:polysaccharide pyruvyl transferase family protein [Oceanobacillus neutriphilus]GGP09215.1 polysaccharide pyruvyl transferase CsaB [Oceanobacillus neutriphilus]
MKHVLYIGWIGYNNLGDELMFECFKEQFYQLGDDYKLDLVNNEKRYLDNAPLQSYDLIVLGGGSILSGAGYPIQPYIIEALYQALQLNKKIMIWGSGIDWVPKSYLIDRQGIDFIKTNELKSIHEKLNAVFNESSWSGVRGPLTKQLLQQAGVKKEVAISGDPAFLLPNKIDKGRFPAPFDPDDKVIGINWGTSFHNIYGRNEITLENQFAEALNQLITEGYKIYFYIMWGADLEHTRRLAAKLNDDTAWQLDNTVYPAKTLMSLMTHFDFTINFKLHANYLSLAAGVPFIALGYRFKIFDFIRSVQLEDMAIATDDPNLVEQIITLEKKITNSRSDIIETMEKQQQAYRLKLVEPFEQGLYI